MKIRMVSLEDGIISCGFRKMAAYVERLNPNTRTCYISTDQWLTIGKAIRGRVGAGGMLDPDSIDEVAQELADVDLIGFSSMTGYADLTKAIVRRVREISPRTFILWGGIHPIIHPADAIGADVDAICTGEGEFAFSEFFEALKEGRDFTATRNFWFKRNGGIIRNGFRPLMSSEELETLPIQKYGGREWIYKKRKGLVPLGLDEYLASNGLAYSTIWSIGCPFHCTYCGNTKFIENDRKYRKIRHPSARYIVDEVKAARETFPHISCVVFQDDSFMAISYHEIRRFAECWRAEVGIPFTVFGVIPNYVQRKKFQALTWAGMNRIRMGIQSGSREILDFYKRPTPLERIEEAAAVCASFAPRYHIPPTYDMILDNPIETKQDILNTLHFLYRLARPYTLNLYSLKVIPNTELAQLLKDRGVQVDDISATYNLVAPTWSNILVYLLTLWRPPLWLFDRLLSRAEPIAARPKRYPKLALVIRFLYLTKRTLAHLRFMDFSALPGRAGYILWKLRVVKLWHEILMARPPESWIGDRPKVDES